MAEQGQLLNSWKDIAAYLERTVRTCQRLETTMGLPVHRLDGSPKAHVFAYSRELDIWLAQKAAERKQRRKARRLRLGLLAAVTVVASAAAVLIGFLGGRSRGPDAWPAPEAKSVVVLPFTDLSPAPGWAYLAEGISGAVRDSLSQLRDFRIPGLASTLAVKDKMPDVRQVARSLDVEYILDGTVQVMGDRLRISAQLVGVGDGLPLWSEPYDMRIGDALGIQDDIAWSIVSCLKAKLRPREETALHRRPTEDPEAYRIYLRGRWLLRRPDEGAPDEALSQFEEALRRDKDFALARAGVAAFYLDKAAPSLTPLVQVDPRALPAEMSEKAGPALASALAADPGLAEAHALNAAAQFWFEWNWGAAGKEFRRALELRPGDAQTRGAYAIYLLSMKRLKEARREIQLALVADPLSPLLLAYSLWIDLGSGRVEEALDEFERIERLEAASEFACTGAALAYLRQGDTKKAEEILRRAWSYSGGLMGRLDLALGACFLKRDDRRGAPNPLGSIARTRERSPISPVLIALGAAEKGDLYAAFDWLETARRERDPQMPFVRVYAECLELDLVRNPRFLAFLNSLGLPR